MQRRALPLALLALAFGALLAFRWTASGGTGRPAPEIAATAWINSAPQRLADLHGKVTLVEFWTYRRGVIRFVHVGEGSYPETERRIEALLEEY